jgi:hypothetical protein
MFFRRKRFPVFQSGNRGKAYSMYGPFRRRSAFGRESAEIGSPHRNRTKVSLGVLGSLLPALSAMQLKPLEALH